MMAIRSLTLVTVPTSVCRNAICATLRLAATNLLSAHLFLGEYEDAYRVLDTYRDTVLFNGAFKFYRDWVLQDFKDFEREGIVRDIPRKEYLRFKRHTVST